MNEATHTPGEWRIVDEPDAYAYRIVAGKPKNETLICRPMGLSVVEREANARLIAAAPELLEALKNLVETPEVRQEDMQAARAALAKASANEHTKP